MFRSQGEYEFHRISTYPQRLNYRNKIIFSCGDYATKLFNDISCSKLFIGVDGIDTEYGITNSNIGETLLNKRMMEAAHRTIILSDSSKIERRGFGKICNLEQINVIITDPGIPQKTATKVEELGIELIIV